MVRLTIDGIETTVADNTSILDAAASINIRIPTLCFLRDINEIDACRMCIVELEGLERLVPACVAICKEGMVVHTNSPRVRAARAVNLRLILAQHNTDCTMCVRNGNCELQELCRDLNVRFNPYEKKVRCASWPAASPLIRDESKCIMCMRCINICEKVQSVRLWDLVGTGSRSHVGISLGRDITESDCTFCGQCITHCPVGALTERDDTEAVFEALKNPDITTVVQVAPAVRAAWAEHLGLSDREATPGRLAAVLRKIGFDYVFDTDFSADLTIMEEGSEFIERFTHKSDYSWPMFTSCCPGWVRFLKASYPELVSGLSTAKSPQQMFGAVAKSYFAERSGIDPHRLFIVSIMPCVSKKSECDEPNQNDACGDKDVDVVLTTRELERLIREEHIDVSHAEEEAFDSPLGTGTGAAVIFGTTGGVMEAALRSAYYLVTGQNPQADAFSGVRPREGEAWHEAEFTIPGAGTVRTAVASGLGNARKLIEAIKSGQVQYDFVEIMACPGGCAGGGGQPIHAGCELAAVRGSLLHSLDKGSVIRFSHENPEVQTLYKDYLGEPLSEKSHHLLHTDHNGWDIIAHIR